MAASKELNNPSSIERGNAGWTKKKGQKSVKNTALYMKLVYRPKVLNESILVQVSRWKLRIEKLYLIVKQRKACI